MSTMADLAREAAAQGLSRPDARRYVIEQTRLLTGRGPGRETLAVCMDIYDHARQQEQTGG